MFSIYIKYLLDNLSSNAKCFAHDASIFSVIHDAYTPVKEFHDDSKINEWALRQKMSFNPDLNKQAQEVILTLFRMRGPKRSPSPPTSFSPVTSTNVGIIPQNFLTFSYNPFATLV